MQSSGYWFETIWEDLRLFEKKILNALGRQLLKQNASSHVYTLQIKDFGLDHLNPSDITERLHGLKNKSVAMRIDHRLAQVPLLTDVRYDDHRKTVTVTFNSLLKGGYRILGEQDIKRSSTSLEREHVINI